MRPNKKNVLRISLLMLLTAMLIIFTTILNGCVTRPIVEGYRIEEIKENDKAPYNGWIVEEAMLIKLRECCAMCVEE